MWKTVTAFKKKKESWLNQESPRQEKTKESTFSKTVELLLSLGMHDQTTEIFNPSVLKAALSLATSP